MPQPDCSAEDKNDSNNKQDADAPACLVALRSNPDNQRAENQSRDETANMSGIVGMA